MSTTIQLTQVYPTVELTYGADFVSGPIAITSGGVAVNLTGYGLKWQIRRGKSPTADLIADLGVTAGTSFTRNNAGGIVEGFVPFSVFVDANCEAKDTVWHDFRVTDTLGRVFYWWRGSIILPPSVTDPEA